MMELKKVARSVYTHMPFMWSKFTGKHVMKWTRAKAVKEYMRPWRREPPDKAKTRARLSFCRARGCK